LSLSLSLSLCCLLLFGLNEPQSPHPLLCPAIHGMLAHTHTNTQTHAHSHTTHTHYIPNTAYQYANTHKHTSLTPLQIPKHRMQIHTIYYTFKGALCYLLVCAV